MMHFDWPWVFALLPLPLLARYLLPPGRSARSAALRIPFLADFEGLSAGPGGRPGKRWLLLAAALIWLLLVIAAARPQWSGEAVELPVSGRDLMLAVDLSGSMERPDFRLRGQQVARLTATKAVAGDFIERRRGDRLGLILFGERAYLQTPLTFDRQTVTELLNEAEIGLAGRKTAIGDAIGLAVKRLRGAKAQEKVLIVMTDGTNTAGEVDPLKAAQLAQEAGFTIYTIGIGARASVVRGILGQRRVNPSAGLDEQALRAIARTTGGRYFRAPGTARLETIYNLLDRLEPIQQAEQSFRPTQALYYWPLGLALVASLGLIIAYFPAANRFAEQG